MKKVYISFAAHTKPALVAGFIKNNDYSAKTLPTMAMYRTPELKRHKTWYVEYYYLIPQPIRHLYKNKIWERFRLTWDMNRRKGEDRETYAAWMLGDLKESLKNGYNPFVAIMENLKETDPEIEVVDADTAFRIFLETWGKRGLDPTSLAKYKKFVNKLLKWLYENKMQYGDVKNITTDHIEKFLQDGEFSNREHNNTLDFIRTGFNFLIKKKIIIDNPCDGIDKRKTKSHAHRYFDTKALETIKKGLMASDPYVFFAFETVYYTCIRSDKELMNFKVGNINWDQNNVFLDPDGTKGKKARYVPLDSNIKAILLERGIDKFPADFYVFGIKGKPSAEPFGSGFFSKRFRKVRDDIGMDKAFTIYGAKHTRVVHLKQDGLDDATIMKLTGHSDLGAFYKYLRDLGVDANPDNINKVSRKI